MFEFWLSGANTPFTVALGLMILLAVLQFVGLSDMIDGDADAGDIDAEAGLLSILGIGRLPFLAWLMLLLLVFGLIGLSGQQLIASFIGEPLSAWLAAPLAGLAALPITGILARPLAAILPKDETTAVSPDQLVGRFATIQIGTAAPGSPARAKVTDVHGQGHNIMVEPDNAGQSFAEGETVLLVRREDGVFKAITRGDTYLPRL